MPKPFGQAVETIVFILGVVLACIPALYLASVAMHKLGLPSPAEAAGAQGQH